MDVVTPPLSALKTENIKVWVLAPLLETTDAHIDYYYDFNQSIAEYEKVFRELGVSWQWQPVTLSNFREVIENISRENIPANTPPVILNLCDGDEINGAPGVSVIRLLDEKGLIYTGSDEYFYRITTSKIPMKQAFDTAGVPSPRWKAIHQLSDIEDVFDLLGTPVIVKPAVSGGSMGVGIKNVVYTQNQLKELVEQMFAGYRGWNLAADGLIAESFINGPEFTVLISGSHNKPEDARVYNPVERVFHESLPDREKFLSFDRLWEIYEDETPMPNQANFYEYALPEASLIEAIKKLSWDAYVACKGVGYTRADIRLEKTTGKLYVLEVNAQCGISEDENYTSIGSILRFNRVRFSTLVAEIINDACSRLPANRQKKYIA